jgi:hypothetical protein
MRSREYKENTWLIILTIYTLIANYKASVTKTLLVSEKEKRSSFVIIGKGECASRPSLAVSNTVYGGGGKIILAKKGRSW